MGITIMPVGGYGEVGRNMTAIRVDDEVVILDMGIHVGNYIAFTEDEDLKNIKTSELKAAKAIPNDEIIKSWRKDVKAIIPTHAHLDHIAAIPFMAGKYNCPIIASPFTIALLKTNLDIENIHLPNKFKSVNVNATVKISDHLKVEFINVTHSTPQSVMVALHTKYGIIIYANDFKFDLTPTLGKKVNFERLRELGKSKKVLCLIAECLYSNEAIKMPSENVAKEMLKEVLLGTDNKGKAVIVTTFSSHIARLKSIIEIGKKMKRKVVFLGRSLSKYVQAAESVKIVNFSKQIEIVKYSSKIRKRLGKVKEKDRAKYLFVVTGHQGEPKATLSKIAHNDIRFKLRNGDHVVFSSKTIPTEENRKSKEVLCDKLRQQGVRIFDDIHISGHAGKEDLRDLISLVNPKMIIPSHGERKMEEGTLKLALEMGYEKEDIKMIKNGQKVKVV
tara:strand:- start:2830 stop:4167 length:1338 start_codon:yes stop_codon:yes gene_type:complete